MSSTLNTAQNITTHYTTMETLGLMTLAMVIALILIALAYRLMKTMSIIGKYDEAVEKVKLIESKVEELQLLLTKAEIEYQRDLAELTQQHSKECFELQQLVFERNGEVIDLKNKLLKFNINTPL